MAASRGRRSLADAARKRPGLFGGNTTFRYVLLAVIICFAVIKFYERFTAGPPSGPINDIFVRAPGSLIITWPDSTDGADSLAAYVEKVAAKLSGNLGHEIRTIPESRLTDNRLEKNSIIIYAPLCGSRLAHRFREYIPFEFEDSTLHYGLEAYTAADHWRLIFLMPNPLNEKRYFLFYTAASAGDIVGINFVESPNFLRGDRTDYVLGVGDKLVAEGDFSAGESGLWRLGN